MQTFQLQNIFSTTGSGAQPTSQSGPEAHGFENILQGMLCTAQQTDPLARACAAGLENMNINHDDALAALTAILDKITEAVGQASQPFSTAQYEAIISNILSDEEIMFLQNLIRRAGGETGGYNSTVDPSGMPAALFEGNSEKTAEHLQSNLQELTQIIQSLITVLEQSGSTEAISEDLHLDASPDMVTNETVQSEEPAGRLPLPAALCDTLQDIRTRYQSMVEQVSRHESAGHKTENNTGLSAPVAQKAPPVSEIMVPDSNITLENDKNFVGGIENIIRQKLNLPKPDVAEAKPEHERPATGAEMIKDTGTETPQQKQNYSFNKQSYADQLSQDTKQHCINNGVVKKLTIERLSSTPQNTHIQSTDSNETVQSQTIAKNKLFEHVILTNSQTENAAKPVAAKLDRQHDPVLFNGMTSRAGATPSMEQTAHIAVKEPLNPVHVLDQIADRINTGMQRGESKITLQINPPDLGKLEIDLSMRDNQLRAIIIAESHHAKHMIESNLDQLRACLEGQNIDVDKVNVFVGQENKQFASHLRDQNGRNKKGIAESEELNRTNAEEPSGPFAGFNPRAYTGDGGYGVDLFA